MQRAAANQRRASIRFIGRQDRRPAAVLHKITGTGNQIGNDVGVAPAEREICIVGHIAGAEQTGRAIRTDLERTAVD